MSSKSTKIYYSMEYTNSMSYGHTAYDFEQYFIQSLSSRTALIRSTLHSCGGKRVLHVACNMTLLVV